MPQMAPLSWLTLFILFSILYILFTIINYFSSHPNPSSQPASAMGARGPSFNWKW
uniref:ATP synthase complex subunit 8 n=1 Tax=Caenis pycnacantha TaxID=675576 RepID=X1W3B7_9INSE|nr:ATP synthase F0 subunit 8 [Caenis pycnacantha]